MRNGDFDAFLQIGTYCSVSDTVRSPVFAYIDHDLPSLVELDPRMRSTSPEASYVRRRFEHEKAALASCARVFTFSEWCKQRVVNDYGVPRYLVEAVGAGSNIEEHTLSAEPDYAARHAVILGFDFYRKGGREVLAAFERVRAQLPNARLTVIGGLPPGRPAPGVTSTGRIVGPNSKQRIAALLSSASLYVMPSLFEPFGIAFLEAMAAGLACIGADTCAMPEIIGDAGAIVPPGDVNELADRMLELLSDAQTCRQLGRAARARYRERYGWEKAALRMRHSMEAVLETQLETLSVS